MASELLYDNTNSKLPEYHHQCKNYYSKKISIKTYNKKQKGLFEFLLPKRKVSLSNQIRNNFIQYKRSKNFNSSKEKFRFIKNFKSNKNGQSSRTEKWTVFGQNKKPGDSYTKASYHDENFLRSQKTTENFMEDKSGKRAVANGQNCIKVNNINKKLCQPNDQDGDEVLCKNFNDFSEIIFYHSKYETNHPIDESITGNYKQCNKIESDLDALEPYDIRTDICHERYKKCNCWKWDCIVKTTNGISISNQAIDNSIRIADNGNGNKIKNNSIFCKHDRSRTTTTINQCCQKYNPYPIGVNVHTIDPDTLLCCPHKRCVKIYYENFNANNTCTNDNYSCQTVCSVTANWPTPKSSNQSKSKSKTAPKFVSTPAHLLREPQLHPRTECRQKTESNKLWADAEFNIPTRNAIAVTNADTSAHAVLSSAKRAKFRLANGSEESSAFAADEYANAGQNYAEALRRKTSPRKATPDRINTKCGHVCCEWHCFATTSNTATGTTTAAIASNTTVNGHPENSVHHPIRQYNLPGRIASKLIGWNNSIKTNTLFAVNDLHKFLRAILPIVILFNMLPLLYAASNIDAPALRGAPNPESRSWIPLVAYLEVLPRITKSPKCDQTFVSRAGGPQNGTFSAPLLHNPGNHSKHCLYIFLAGPGQRVEVVFTSFNLRGTPPDGSAVGELPACIHEYMDIYAEVQSSDPGDLINSPFGGRYCGPIPPRRRISMYRAVALSFFTNKNFSTSELFEGRYSFINASEYEIGIPLAGSPCSYTVTPTTSINKTGALVSPTYPGAYPKDMSCTYQFLGESNQRVRLEFRDFDLFFGGPHCPFDYVKVYDGSDNSSALIGTYCGQQRNLVLYSSESSLFVHFFTLSRTANTQNRGFKGIYEFSESFVKLEFIRQNNGIHIRGSECDQKILSKKESTGNVLSPNYPYPFIPKTVCRYFVYGMQDAQHLERVRLEFSIFEIPRVESKDKGGESNCTDGYLKIYLRGQETADAYDKFDYELCGNESETVVSDGPRLAMVFSSGELQGRGFKAKYTFETEYKIPGTAAPDGKCSFKYISSSKKKGELNSPRYPSNYPSDIDCSYIFEVGPNEQVTLVFDHFKVKADNVNTTGGAYGVSACFEDWLELYVIYGIGHERFFGRYCGLTAPGPLESPKGAIGLRIKLHTDQENVASGFKARYVFEAAKSEFGDCGGNYSGQDSGIITSPHFPSNYKGPGKGLASSACNWYITARLGYRILINFEFFLTEGEPLARGCAAVVVRVWTSLESDMPPTELCGEKLTQTHFISQGQSARISFTTSDKTIGGQGFRIVWTEIHDTGPGPPSSIALMCESSYHFRCNSGYCIADRLRCDGTKNCGPDDDSDEKHCTMEAPKEDHGVLIICSIAAGSFLICLLCTLCHRKRKRRHHRQLGLHRNAAHYDSTTSATGLSSSRRHLQGTGGGSLSGSLHGIDPGALAIPPAPSPPTSVPPLPHICISAGGAGMLSGGEEDDDDDEDNQDLFVNDVRFDDDDDNNDESV